MVIEALVTILKEDSAVAAIVGDRVYPVTAPDAPDYPFLVLTKATGLGEYTMAGDAGIESARIQVDCQVDDGAAACIALKTAVRRKLSGFRGGVSGHPCQVDAIFCINDFDLTEPATERAGPRVRRRTLEFTVWHREI
jgi:hypothetical protein